MFGLFKKKENIQIPFEGRRWFINDIIDKIYKIEDINERLESYISLYEIIVFLEDKFQIKSLEMSLAFDEISDAFFEADDINIIYSCALSYDRFPAEKNDKLTEYYLLNLDTHLKLRLFRWFVHVNLYNEDIDHREIDPNFQHVFFEIDRRNLSDTDKSKVLSEEFGISDWKSRRELNGWIGG